MQTEQDRLQCNQEKTFKLEQCKELCTQLETINKTTATSLTSALAERKYLIGLQQNLTETIEKLAKTTAALTEAIKYRDDVQTQLNAANKQDRDKVDNEIMNIER